MIALLSAQIEAGARAFATLLVNLLPFLPDSLVTKPEQLMIVVGFAGQGLFAMRFIIQWLSSEKQAKSVIPLAFWYFSIGGGGVLLPLALLIHPVHLLILRLDSRPQFVHRSSS